jgi:acetyl-CoA carboxylase biotin carboxylase subunit
LEEAPSVALDADQRDRLNDATVKGLTVAGYTNAGTVEFLLEKTGRFYFLEVNKRLQVEHLVSELTTRIDLVEEQLNVVSNESLELSQNEIRVNGWAINCRINAEDPQANFVPSPGTVIRYHPPTGPGVRIDSALFSGCNIPEYYDSLIAKLATWGVNRTDAIQRMKIALDETEIFGVPTTIPMHRELMRDEAFVSGNFDTTYLNEFLPRLNETILHYERFAAVVAAAGKAKTPSTRNDKDTIKPSRWRTTARSELMAGSNRSGW